MRVLLLLVLFAFSSVSAQTYKFVNADSLPLYEVPDTTSRVYIILHAPCKIEVQEITDKRYQKYPEILSNWYIVRFLINDGTRFGGVTYKGYLRRDKLVDKRELVTVPSLDPAIAFSYSIPGDTIRHDLRFFKSSKGGCYYINATGKKEYVNFCR
jgi:hypothetical protein